MSDGASVSFDPGPWAEILVRRFADDVNICRAWLDGAIKEYQSDYDRETMAWMQQAAFDQGSFATLLGVVSSPDSGNVRVMALGDFLLAFVDGDELVRTIPYLQPAEFDQSPHLLSSSPAENGSWSDEDIAERWHDLNVASHRAPTLLLMTDAIGRWLLDQPDTERVSTLLNITDEDAFAQFVKRESAEGRLRKDDATLVVVGSDL